MASPNKQQIPTTLNLKDVTPKASLAKRSNTKEDSTWSSKVRKTGEVMDVQETMKNKVSALNNTLILSTPY